MSNFGEKIMSAILPVAGAAGLCLVAACEPPPADQGRQQPEPEEGQQAEPQSTQPEQEEQKLDR